MFRKIAKLLLTLVVLFLSLLFLAVTSATFWAMSAPRSLPYVTEKISERLNATDVGYGFEIGDTLLQWDGWEEHLSFHIKRLQIIDLSDGTQVAAFPDVAFDIDLSQIIFGEFEFTGTRIIEPRLTIDLSGNSEIVTYGEPAYTEEIDQLIFSVFSALEKLKLSKDFPIHSLSIFDAEVVVNNGVQEIPWQVPEAFVKATLNEIFPGFEFSAELLDSRNSRRSFVSLSAKDDSRTGKVKIVAEVNNIESQYISDFMPKFKWLSDLTLDSSGKSTLLFDRDKKLESMDFQVISRSEDSMSLGVTGDLKFVPEYKGVLNVPSGKIAIQGKDISVAQLDRYWPPNIAADAREWVVANITKGEIEDIDVEIDISQDNYVNQAVEKDSIDGKMNFNGLSISYLEDFEPVKEARGFAKFDGTSLRFDILDSKMTDSEVKGDVLITGFDEEYQLLQVNVVSDGKISDIRNFLMLLQGGDNSAELFDISKLNGLAVTKHHYSFPLYKELKIKDINFKASSDLSDVSLPGVGEGIDLTGGKFQLKVDASDLAVKGVAYLNKVFAEIDWKEDLTSSKEFESIYKIKSTFTPAEIKSLSDTDLIKWVNGPMDAILTIKQKDQTKNIDASISLDGAEIDADILGWKKKTGEKAVLKIKATDEYKKSFKIDSFSFVSDYMNAAGYAKSDDFDPSKSIVNFKTIKYGNTDITARLIRSKENDLLLNVSGKSFDAVPLLESYAYDNRDEENKFNNLEMEVQLEKIILSNGVEITDAEGNIFCQDGKCNNFGLLGNLDDNNKVEISYKPDIDDLVMIINSGDGGKILRGFDIIETVRGGDFSTSARASVKNQESPFNGKLIMKDFKVVKAPVLAKMLTLASFTGIVDLLNGDGINFKKLRGKYTFDNEVLKLREIKATGDSLAITIEGDVNFKTNQIKLQGNVVPATLLNRLIENIPLVGFAITGGGDQSVIATRYTIVGSFDNPDVTVNPFSMLTPGFLRNIWGDVLDEDLKSTDSAKEEVKEELSEP